jgi:hypothetical protein
MSALAFRIAYRDSKFIMFLPEIDPDAYRPDFDQLTQSLDETLSGERAVRYDVYEVLAVVNCGTDPVKNAINTPFRVVDRPAGQGAKEFSIELPSLPWT